MSDPLGKLLTNVDWPRAAQLFGSFCRVLRGDTVDDIKRDGERALAKASKLSTTLKQAASEVASELNPND